jgi:hypothetical protein
MDIRMWLQSKMELLLLGECCPTQVDHTIEELEIENLQNYFQQSKLDSKRLRTVNVAIQQKIE